MTVALPPPRVTERLSSYSDSSRSSESLAHCPQIVIQETRRGENHVIRHNSRPPANVRSELSERIIVPSFGPAQTFSKLFRAAEPKIPQNSVMRRVHIDGAGHRVADEKQRNPVPQSELCGWGLPSLIPNACDRGMIADIVSKKFRLPQLLTTLLLIIDFSGSGRLVFQRIRNTASRDRQSATGTSASTNPLAGRLPAIIRQA